MITDENSWTPLIIASLVAVVTAVAGGLATEIGPWYTTLKKPSWQPPNWLFGPVWTTIFILAVIASVMAWRRAESSFDQILTIGLFGINALLNIFWSLIFFTLKRPDWAVVEVAFLWLSILVLIVFFWRFSPTSSLLLLPYLIWVSIASYLNWTIIKLNPPFGI
jgi:translocator protein